MMVFSNEVKTPGAFKSRKVFRTQFIKINDDAITFNFLT